MSEQARPSWEIAAAAFAHPALIVTAGAVGIPRLSQSGGGMTPDDPPTSVTVRYDEDNVTATTYWNAEWYDGEMAVFSNPWEFVESQAQWHFVKPPSFEGRKVISETRIKGADGRVGGFRKYEPLPAEVAEAEREARMRRVSELDHREVSLPLQDQAVTALVVGEKDTWVATFEIGAAGQLIGLLSGTGTPIEQLSLALTDDLLSYLRTGSSSDQQVD